MAGKEHNSWASSPTPQQIKERLGETRSLIRLKAHALMSPTLSFETKMETISELTDLIKIEHTLKE